MKDLAGYLARMEVGIKDKLFFLEKVDISKFNYFVDFGCANGKIVENLYQRFPNVTFVNYDRCKMLNSIKYTADNVINTDDLRFVEKLEGNNCILFSSVLHEFELAGLDPIDFLGICHDYNCIIIRDMYLDTSDCDVTELQLKEKGYDISELRDDIEPYKKIYQMLLMYKYVENWETEIKESYFSYDFDMLEWWLPRFGFVLKYKEYFQLPHFKKQILEDFGFEPLKNTHIKLIFQKDIKQKIVGDISNVE